MKLGDFNLVVDLKATLKLLGAFYGASQRGELHLTAKYDGNSFDFGQILTCDEARGALNNLIRIKIDAVKGNLRELGVDPDA